MREFASSRARVSEPNEADADDDSLLLSAGCSTPSLDPDASKSTEAASVAHAHAPSHRQFRMADTLSVESLPARIDIYCDLCKQLLYSELDSYFISACVISSALEITVAVGCSPSQAHIRVELMTHFPPLAGKTAPSSLGHVSLILSPSSNNCFFEL